jgi:CheY-like chemotaxis protein
MSADPTSASRHKVLIVDDDPTMRALLRAAIEKLPVAIAEASDGKEAMKLIDADRPDLLLSDYQMPGWDGLTLCHHLHRQTDLKPIRTVLITGALMPPDLLSAVNHKMVDAALPKPVDVQELRQLVTMLLGLDKP